MPRRRAEPRKTLICRIAALWTDEEGTLVNLTGLLEDRSRSGVGISVPEPIAVGTRVRIYGRVRELRGIVRHCRYKAGKYFVGVRLDDEDKSWDRFGIGL